MDDGGLASAQSIVFFFVPLPVSRVRQTALIQVRPEAAENVFVELPGTLERLHVRNGQWVEQGDVLAEFRNVELEGQLEEARPPNTRCGWSNSGPWPGKWRRPTICRNALSPAGSRRAGRRRAQALCPAGGRAGGNPTAPDSAGHAVGHRLASPAAQ